MKPPVLRWKQNQKPTGLARIGARHPGHSLRSPDGRVAAVVYPLDRAAKLWYWVSGWDYNGEIPGINTCNDGGLFLADAKAAAGEWCRKHLSQK